MINELKQKNILVIGSGVSGISAVNLLREVGAVPFLYDENKTELPIEIDIPLYIGNLPPTDLLRTIDLAVISPGISLNNPNIKEIMASGIPIISEIELAYIYTKGRIIAITGTNGKTTTVTMVGEIMKTYFPSVYVVGNIGRPFSEIALETRDETIIVLEVSSFQLETIKNFTPYISAILNITPDHLDRHETMENYVKVKERIAENQNKDNFCILNLDNEYTAAFTNRCKAQAEWFSTTKELNNGCYFKDNVIHYAENGKAQVLLHRDETKLVGFANIENIMAAILAGIKMGIPLETILSAVKQFRAVSHRLEYVATRNGVDYYNDSKATNPDAAIQGIRAMTKPTILLAGGSCKKADYNTWLLECKDKVKALILFGETKEDIATAASAVGIKNIYKVVTITDVINICKEVAVPGDAILLSPACASFDMFKNYEERGDKFKELVLGGE